MLLLGPATKYADHPCDENSPFCGWCLNKIPEVFFNAPIQQHKRWVDTCTHEFPHIVGQQLTCDVRPVTICSRCGQEVS
jgi:hypothetical protein